MLTLQSDESESGSENRKSFRKFCFAKFYSVFILLLKSHFLFILLEIQLRQYFPSLPLPQTTLISAGWKAPRAVLIRNLV